MDRRAQARRDNRDAGTRPQPVGILRARARPLRDELGVRDPRRGNATLAPPGCLGSAAVAGPIVRTDCPRHPSARWRHLSPDGRPDQQPGKPVAAGGSRTRKSYRHARSLGVLLRTRDRRAARRGSPSSRPARGSTRSTDPDPRSPASRSSSSAAVITSLIGSRSSSTGPGRSLFSRGATSCPDMAPFLRRAIDASGLGRPSGPSRRSLASRFPPGATLCRQHVPSPAQRVVDLVDQHPALREWPVANSGRKDRAFGDFTARTDETEHRLRCSPAGFCPPRATFGGLGRPVRSSRTDDAPSPRLISQSVHKMITSSAARSLRLQAWG